MTIAKITDDEQFKEFEDAMKKGIERATKTLERGAWIQDQKSWSRRAASSNTACACG
jgi:hypothetical protein